MFDASKVLVTLSIPASALAVWMACAEDASPFVDGVPASLYATAAAAWSQAHCGSNLQLKAGAPRLMPDDLLRLAAQFDLERAETGIEAACRAAITAAAAVSEQASITPARANGNNAVALRN